MYLLKVTFYYVCWLPPSPSALISELWRNWESKVGAGGRCQKVEEKIFPGFQPGNCDFRSQSKCTFKSYELLVLVPPLPPKLDPLSSKGDWTPVPSVLGGSRSSLFPRETCPTYSTVPGEVHECFVNSGRGASCRPTLFSPGLGTAVWANSSFPVMSWTLMWSFRPGVKWYVRLGRSRTRVFEYTHHHEGPQAVWPTYLNTRGVTEDSEAVHSRSAIRIERTWGG